ncbi:MAG: GH25 family lysozyme [Coriobacteriia bacterium]|nr:GH25 family lysozyme [Coriobacteriia bacterium]
MTLIKRLTLAAAGAAFALCCGPALALAAPSAVESQDLANSWRYADGQPIAVEAQQEGGENAAGSFAPQSVTLQPLATRTSWKPSYGLSCFYYDGVRYSTSAVSTGVKAVCIDVSEHNGVIDWHKVRASGVKYAIIRCGYGGNFRDQDDYRWLYNIRNARKAGITCGVYLYSYAYNTAMAKSEADHALRCLREAGLTPSKLGLPVFYDLEETRNGKAYTQGHYISKKTLGQMAQVFNGRLKAAGYKVGVYANTHWWKNLLTSSAFDNPSWWRWVAQYNKRCELPASRNYGRYLDAWQFTSTGRVDGISGAAVDVSFLYKVPKPSSYAVTYKLGGGTNSSANPKRYYSSKSVTLKSPTRRGYSFKGWYTSSKFKSTTRVKVLGNGMKGSKTLYAKWSKKVYTITFKPNGGKLYASQRTKFTVTSSKLKLHAPTRAGYVFRGWYAKADFSGSARTYLNTGSAGNRTFYAKWDREPYQATVTNPEGTTVYASATSDEPAGDVLAYGTVVTVVSKQGDRVKLDDGTWVLAADLTEGVPDEPQDQAGDVTPDQPQDPTE